MSAVTLPARWVYDDGGRAAAGLKPAPGDCFPRAVAIAAELPYGKVYDEVTRLQSAFLFRSTRGAHHAYTPDGRRRSPTPYGGTFHRVVLSYMRFNIGWDWTPLLFNGSSSPVRLRAEDLPSGRLIAKLSGHVVAVIDGVIHDLSDPSNDGKRAVYGYWQPPESAG